VSAIRAESRYRGGGFFESGFSSGIGVKGTIRKKDAQKKMTPTPTGLSKKKRKKAGN